MSAIRRMVATNARTDQALADHTTLARSPWTRMRGLLGKRGMDEGEALLIEPCQGIHTWFMRFAIDVLFLDREGRVVRVCPEVRPYRMVPFVRGAHRVLELPAGTAGRTETMRGDLVAFRDAP